MACRAVADTLWVANVIDCMLAMEEVLHIHRTIARIAATRCIGDMTDLAGLDRVVVARTMLRDQLMTIVAALDID